MRWPLPYFTTVCSAGLGAALVGLMAGCSCGDSRPWIGVPPPTGTLTRRIEEAQAFKAEATDFVFFLDEWFMGGPKLGPKGGDHLAEVIRRLPTVPFPVVLQPHPDMALNEKRRESIVLALKTAGVPDADTRVLIANPQAEDLNGELAEQDYMFMLINNWRNGFLGGLYGQGFNGGFGAYGLGGFGSIGLGGRYLGFGRTYGLGLGPFGY